MTRDDRGRVLLVKQRGGPFKDAWLLPGGGLEGGESFEDALRREVLEETGLALRDPHLVKHYDVLVGEFHGVVQMFSATVSGEPRVGQDGEAVRWSTVDTNDAHPVLLRELKDAGVIAMEDAEIDTRLARAGIRMTAGDI